MNASGVFSLKIRISLESGVLTNIYLAQKLNPQVEKGKVASLYQLRDH